MRKRKVILLGVVLLAFLFAVGCPGPGPGVDRDVERPIVGTISFEPSSLRFTGGQVRITAQVSDNRGVVRVRGEVEKPDGTKDNLPERTYPLQKSVTYQVTYNFPANTGVEDAVYTVLLKAVDEARNEGENKANFTVPAPEGPPGPPPL